MLLGTQHPTGSLTHSRAVLSKSSAPGQKPLLLPISCSTSGHYCGEVASLSRQRATELLSIPKRGGSIVLGGRDSKASVFSLARNLLPASLCLAAPWD